MMVSEKCNGEFCREDEESDFVKMNPIDASADPANQIRPAGSVPHLVYRL